MAPTPDQHPATTTTILLVRHGQSVANAEGRWQGSLDSPLSTEGVRQARAAAAVLGGFDTVVSSDLVRAHRTAEIIAGELGIGPVVVDPALRERTAGAWEGLTKPEIDERYPGDREAGRVPSGWEHDDAVCSRATAALGSIAASVGPGATALVVSHGGVIRCLEALAGVERVERLTNLGGRWFHVGPRTFRAGEAVRLVADDLDVAPGQV